VTDQFMIAADPGIKLYVRKTKRIPGDQPFAWPKAEEASHAVREYLVAPPRQKDGIAETRIQENGSLANA
jgi:hypothetical protein